MRPQGAEGGSASSTAATKTELAHGIKGDHMCRKLEFDELITKDEMKKLRGARVGDGVARLVTSEAPPATTTIAPQPERMMVMQSMFDKQGDRMEYMMKGIDNRTNAL